MRMKSGYIWVLLLLTTTACTSSLEQQGGSEVPLSMTQRAADEDRLALTRPVALTRQEEQAIEDFKDGKLPALTPLEQQRLVHLVIGLKIQVNRAKNNYRQKQDKQEKRWNKQEIDEINLEKQQWWKSLTPDQKVHFHEYMHQQEQANLRLQNEILEAWGGDITVVTQELCPVCTPPRVPDW